MLALVLRNEIESLLLFVDKQLRRGFMGQVVRFGFITALLVLAPALAEAKGCIKGALVGGAVGHYAGHHGVLGAAAGCLVGRHRAKTQARASRPSYDRTTR